jgi:2-polyprenyl-6-methoxyphenol hydroxylase-like FAD-dependent oxidoreductase
VALLGARNAGRTTALLLKTAGLRVAVVEMDAASGARPPSRSGPQHRLPVHAR